MITFSGGERVKSSVYEFGGGHTSGGGGGGLVAKLCPTLVTPEGCDSDEPDGLQSMGSQ